MRESIATWEARLIRETGLDARTITGYTRDVARFAAWVAAEGDCVTPADVTAHDVKGYRDHLVRRGCAPATVNRTLVSLGLFFDAMDRRGDNPARRVARVESVVRPPQALDRAQWNAVRRAAARMAPRDGGRALALICLMRHAGPRVGEVAALHIPDVRLSARRGLLVIRRGKGLKHREVPLTSEAREPLRDYLDHRRTLSERWAREARRVDKSPPGWAAWPDGHLFLGQRGPLRERGIHAIVSKLGQAAKLDAPLSPHDLRHTFAKALLDPAAYDLDRPAAPITVVQELLGHATIVTTTLYARASQADLARFMGDNGEFL